MNLCEHCGVSFYPPAPDWVEFVATADGKTYKIHFSELQMAQDRGLVKTVLGKVPFSPVHCDLCSSMLVAVCLPYFARLQAEFEQEHLRIIVKKEQLLKGESDDDE